MSIFKELIYANETVIKTIVQKWPEAKITDARISVHDELFEVEIDGISEDEFYPYAIKHQFLKDCFYFKLTYERLSAEKVENLKAKLEQWNQVS